MAHYFSFRFAYRYEKKKKLYIPKKKPKTFVRLGLVLQNLRVQLSNSFSASVTVEMRFAGGWNHYTFLL